MVEVEPGQGPQGGQDGAEVPVELTSPNFPGNSNASNLDCEWVVRPRFGTKVSSDTLFNLS